MCLARGIYFSRNTAGLPKARSASLLRFVEQSLRDRRALCTTRMPRPPPPNAALMMSGKPISCAIFSASPRSSIGSSVPGSVGHVDFLRESARRRFVAHQFEQFRTRADESDAGFVAGAGEVGVLGEKAVARMNHVDALFLRQRDDAFDVEIRADRPFAFADQIGFVRLETVHGKPILLRVNGDGAQPEFRGGAKNADGDFAAIGGEKFFESAFCGSGFLLCGRFGFAHSFWCGHKVRVFIRVNAALGKIFQVLGAAQGRICVQPEALRG